MSQYPTVYSEPLWWMERHLEPLTPEERAELEAARPKTRADCESVPRPCPFVACRYNLYLDVSPVGSLLFDHPEIGPEEMQNSCALDLAEAGPQIGEVVGRALGVTRQRVDQIQQRASRKLKARIERLLAKEKAMEEAPQASRLALVGGD